MRVAESFPPSGPAAPKEEAIEFDVHRDAFEHSTLETFYNRCLHVPTSVLKSTGRETLGCMLGRANLEASFFDPSGDGGYFPRR